MSDVRRVALESWVAAWLAKNRPEWQPKGGLSVVSGDASFRRYFRQALTTGSSLIAVDAPSEKENSRPFVAIAQALHAHGVCVPEVLAADFDRGFMLLEDFGDSLLRPALTDLSVDELYGQAMKTLEHLLTCSDVPDHSLPPYDKKRLMGEMVLIRDWFIAEYLELKLSPEQLTLLEDAFEHIADAVVQQPQAFVHRDYHSRNLMLLADGRMGVIDFQDAVTGPITYDLVSLLRDAYVEWPNERVCGWVARFAELLRQSGEITVDNATFQRWFDWMGAQRHLKVVGIFARLSLRDGKHGYLNDIPLVFDYLLAEIAPYEALKPLFDLLRNTVLPAYLQKKPEASERLGRWLNTADQQAAIWQTTGQPA